MYWMEAYPQSVLLLAGDRAFKRDFMGVLKQDCGILVPFPFPFFAFALILSSAMPTVTCYIVTGTKATGMNQ